MPGANLQYFVTFVINKEIIISKVKIMVITWSKVHVDDSRHILNESKGLKVEE